MQRCGIEIGDRAFQFRFRRGERRDLLGRIEFRRLGLMRRRLTVRVAVAVALPVAPAATAAAPPPPIVAPLRVRLDTLLSCEIARSLAKRFSQGLVNRLVPRFGAGLIGRSGMGSGMALIRRPILILRAKLAGRFGDWNMFNVLLRLAV